MSKKTGGPAFPEPVARDCNGDRYQVAEGMTLRDYFAAAALPAVITAYIEENGRCIGTDHFPSNVPTLAYRMANAMLAERSKP